MTKPPPSDLVAVKSARGAREHVLDRRYAPVGRGLCGAKISLANRPGTDPRHVDCATCRLAAGAPT